MIESAEIPIGNEAARARVNRAILTRLQRLATVAQRDQAIRQEVYDALDTLQESWAPVLQCVSQLAKLQLQARGMVTDEEMFEGGGDGGIDDGDERDRR